ncbi:MAG TPA: hypothetical protein VE690_03985 [Rhodopila sp.]|nr:hypothetical protein [Rhodopila sp.]
MMALAFGSMALIPDVAHLVGLLLIICGISYFFTEFGPEELSAA